MCTSAIITIKYIFANFLNLSTKSTEYDFCKFLQNDNAKIGITNPYTFVNVNL